MTVSIEITPVVVEADEQTLTRRKTTVQRLDKLGQIDASAGSISTEMTAGWQATINGTTVPLEGYAVEPDGGRVLVSLVFPADAVSIGQVPTSTPAPAEPANKPPASVWGAPGRPDPREAIPGWAPRDAYIPLSNGLGQQVAANAEAGQK